MHAAVKRIDVRTIVPRDRHPLIFATFDALAPGEVIEIVNDHDPKPLYYQFQAERNGQLAWTYLEEGPDVWRVRLGRVDRTITLDTTVNDVLRAAPDLGGLLNDLGVDTCCGGSSTLEEAAVDAGVDGSELLAQVHRALSR